MSRYINADELIFIGLDNPDDDHLFEFVPREFIDNAPTADVVEVVHGEWIKTTDVDIRLMGRQIKEVHYKCSVCGGESYFDTNYCSHCGADMRGEPDEKNR